MSKSGVIRATVLVAGLYYVFAFLLQDKEALPEFEKRFFKPVGEVYSDIIIVLGSFAVGVGVVNIFQVHLRRIIRVQPNWEYSIVLLVSFTGMFALGVLKWLGPTRVGAAATLFEYVVSDITSHMDSTIYSFLAFFVTSAALRAFRVRSKESAVMMVAAVLVLLALSPQTNVRLISSVRDWVDAYVQTPVFRGLTFGVYLGGITVSLRMWLGIERTSLFEEM